MSLNDREKIEKLFDRLWGLARSITGPAYQESLKILSEYIPFDLIEFPTGYKAYDWEVPEEWEAHDAYIIDPNGKKRACFKDHNLHLMSFSSSVDKTMPLNELKKHLYSLPDQPTAIPYVTSYFERRWGLCLTHEELKSLPDGDYQVKIDTSFKPGHLVVGETVLPGESKEEILLSSYLCHPSLANNELSGPLVLAFLYQKIAALPNRKYTYRFVINPETLGSICYLSKKGNDLKKKVKAGFVITCTGDRGAFSYKESWQADSLANRVAQIVLKEVGTQTGQKPNFYKFDPSCGSDERQYNSPGFRMPVGSVMRTMYNQFSEYHTSLDDKNFISFDSMLEAVDVYFEMIQVLEANEFWESTNPYCEPLLSKRGLYPDLSVKTHSNDKRAANLWVMNLADGQHDLIAMAKHSGLTLSLLREVIQDLSRVGLIKKRPFPID